jgi:hypothetical protein
MLPQSNPPKTNGEQGMKNTTNWYLYTSWKSKKKSTATAEPAVENKEVEDKINLIRKAIR